jgi:hypothetical protein
MNVGLGIVAHACNPTYVGDGDWEDHGSRPVSWTKMFAMPISTNNAGHDGLNL